MRIAVLIVVVPDDPDFVPLSARQRLLASPFAVAAGRSDRDFQVPGQLAVSGNASLGGTDVTGSLQATGDLAGPGQPERRRQPGRGRGHPAGWQPALPGEYLRNGGTGRARRHELV